MTSKLLSLCSQEDKLTPRDPLQNPKKKSKKSKSKRHRRYSDESDSTDSEAEERRRRKRREKRRKEYSDEERAKSDDSEHEDDRERRKRRTKSRSKSALSPAPGKTDWIEKEKSGVADTTITAEIQSDSDDGEMVVHLYQPNIKIKHENKRMSCPSPTYFNSADKQIQGYVTR